MCEQEIPDRYYKIINQTSEDLKQSTVSVFVGQVPENVRSILTLIEKNKLFVIKEESNQF